MDRKKRKRNRLSDGVARLYRQESADGSAAATTGATAERIGAV